jgi:hypothetical protein
VCFVWWGGFFFFFCFSCPRPACLICSILIVPRSRNWTSLEIHHFRKKHINMYVCVCVWCVLSVSLLVSYGHFSLCGLSFHYPSPTLLLQPQTSTSVVCIEDPLTGEKRDVLTSLPIVITSAMCGKEPMGPFSAGIAKMTGRANKNEDCVVCRGMTIAVICASRTLSCALSRQTLLCTHSLGKLCCVHTL